MYMMHDIEANMEANKYYHVFLQIHSHVPDVALTFPITFPCRDRSFPNHVPEHDPCSLHVQSTNS